MARILIAIALVAALALVLFVWFGASSRAPTLDGHANAAADARKSVEEPSDSLDVEFKTRVESVEVSARTAERASSSAQAPSNDLRVRVVDPAGEPVADVPARLLPGLETKHVPDQAGLQALRTTDAEGYALFANVRSILAASQDAARAESWCLVHEIPFDDLPVLRLDRSQLELPIVVSTIPFSGMVDVHVRDLDGNDVKDGSRVELRMLRDEDLASLSSPSDRPFARTETHAGVAHFPCVQLGRTCEVLAANPGSSIRTGLRAAGPAKARTSASIEIVLGADHPVVVFRAVDMRKNPLKRVTLEINRGDAFSGGRDQTETDAAGRFMIELENVRGQRRWSDLVVSHHADDGSTLLGRPTIGEHLEPGLNEGGDVVLAPEPLLTDGLVQDLAGMPVADADICVGEGQRKLATGSGDILDSRGKSDAHGRFELHGLVTNGAFDLWAMKGELRSAKMRAHEGQRGIVLTLSTFYTVSGRFLLDDGIQPYWITPSFVDAEHSALRPEVPKRLPDGSFTLAPIPAGVYDIAWSYENARVVELDKVDVTTDIDLGSIDLRGKLHRYEITLTGAPPSSKVTGEIAWRPSGSQEKWKNKIFFENKIALITPTSPVDVWVRPDRYRGDVLFGVVDRAEMPLIAPLHVRLELHTNGQLPKFPYILYVDLQQDGVSVGQRTSSQSFMDDNRSLNYEVSAPGRMRVSWHLEWHSDTKTISGGVLEGNESEIQVADIPGEQVFPIELDGDALTKLTTKPPW
jgi:hypothetical protein